MKILLTGTTGQLGKSIVFYKPQKIDIIKTTRKELDLSNRDQCFEFIQKHNPDWVINAGAYTNVDKAEQDKDKVYKINAEGPKHISAALKETRGKLLQISSDYVFSGKSTNPYKVNDLKEPISVYGMSKLKAEEEIKKFLFKKNKAVILRTSWLIGAQGENFLTKMLDLQNKLSSIRVVSDQIGCITSTYSLAKICWLIVTSKKDVPQILHWRERGKTNWYKIALEINRIANELNLISNKPNIIPIASNDYKSIAERPKFSLLDISQTESFFKIQSKDWKESLKSILLEIKSSKQLINFKKD